MNSAKQLHIFKPGRQTAMSGDSLDFSEADLAACAAAYDPAKHEAPIVIGHPSTDGPAYGWVKSLTNQADGLFAEPSEVDPAFAELVAAGRYKKISASFYLPDAPANPVPGNYYLRHVGFLGAQPPAVKGLKAVAFAGNDEGVIAFADWDDQTNAGLWRSLRDWIIGKFGSEEADRAVPGWDVTALDRAATQAEPAPQPAQFSEPDPKEQATVTPEQAAALQAENAALKAQNANLAAEKRRVEFGEFIDKQIKAGRLLPADKDASLAFMESLPQGESVSFGEGDAKTTPLAWFKGFVERVPAQVSFGENKAAQGDVPADSENPRAIADLATALHTKAKAEGQPISFAEAVQRVTSTSNGA